MSIFRIIFLVQQFAFCTFVHFYHNFFGEHFYHIRWAFLKLRAVQGTSDFCFYLFCNVLIFFSLYFLCFVSGRNDSFEFMDIILHSENSKMMPASMTSVWRGPAHFD